MPARWIHSPAVDVALGLAWVPFTAVAIAVDHDRHAIGVVLSLTFFLSFAHQPLTLPLVYGDPGERTARRRLYRWSPVVFFAAAVGGLAISVPVVAVIAGLWNAEHTLMQRFGITRIYGRKAGEEDGRLERMMLISWLVLAVVVAAASASTRGRVARIPLGEVNATGLQLLTDLRPVGRVLLPAAIVAAALCTGRFLVVEFRRRRAGTANPAKHLYLVSTAALVGVMLVEPVAGFVGYIGAHALEYFLIVHRSLGSRYADGSGGALGRLVRLPSGRRQFFALYALTMVVLMGGLLRYGTEHQYLIAVLFLGGLHVFYDGFIWKLRRPAVARGLVTAPS